VNVMRGMKSNPPVALSAPAPESPPIACALPTAGQNGAMGAASETHPRPFDAACARQRFYAAFLCAIVDSISLVPAEARSL
jgi:hypothetical protein